MAIVTKNLLAWYNDNGRKRPWRVSPKDANLGKVPDPYKIWISEIMLQQTTVSAVIPYFKEFVKKWNCINKLSKAEENDILAFWAGLGYYARARNLLKCAKELSNKFDAKIPNDKKILLSLPGIGEYTASAIRSIAFGEREIVIDANIERVICRLFKIEKPVNQSKIEIRKYASHLFPKYKCGDFAQALMDYANSVCRPKKPKCKQCIISSSCLSCKHDMVEIIPVKQIKKNKLLRRGYVFFTKVKPNKILIERRPREGILGGLLGFPTTKWEVEKNTAPTLPFKANWTFTDKVVNHQFTHFKLELKIVVAESENPKFDTSKYFMLERESFDLMTLPTLMRKVYVKASKL